MVNLYSKKNCQQCKMTARKLDSLGVPYNKIDVELDAKALSHVKDLGYQGLPVVEFNNVHFQGFHPQKLNELVKEQTI